MIISKLVFGSTFLYENEIFILTQDQNRKQQRNCINVKNGSSQWIDETVDVQISPLYRIDENSNFIPLIKDGIYELVQN